MAIVRMAKGNWSPVFHRVWDDEKFIELSCDAKLAWLMLLTDDHGAVPGYVKITGGGVADRLNIEDGQAALMELEQAGLIQYDGRRVFIRNWVKYQYPRAASNLDGWMKHVRRWPPTPARKLWLQSVRDWYTVEAPARLGELAKHSEFNNLDPTPDPPVEGEGRAITKNEELRTKKGDSESSTSSESSGTSLPSLPSAAPAAQPVLLRSADNAKRVFADWVTENEAKAVALGCPPGLFEAMALRCMEEFQHYYDTTTSNGRMTDNRILKFVKRVRRVDPLLVLQGMELYIDAHGGKKPWEYCAKIITNQTTLSEKERNRDLDRHRARYREGVWNEAITTLAENRAEHGHEQVR